ncbi:alpha/beta fold hydrolase [Paenibacillus hexagrammi]|uniref:Alpha/beta hydrolase n=1 Tax=Paenibacillus hexagrammi TaxID=2908839 RepID=A0ABY3SFQ2_9BACL|nr:alpha/beta hydrolase [Paenibacillus sp. YPD9-1]UJF32270.1 alpha/beta hydrolase [Paenibacillus sp. YPD9-1]
MPFAHVNGTSLHYHSTGKGIPIIFIHPPLMTSQTFNYQKAQLSDEFRVITFDIRGHGLSNPSERTFTYSLIVEDMRQLMNYLDIKEAYVCGYSTGGSIALEALLAYPKQFIGGIIVSGMSEVNDTYNKSRIWLAAQMERNQILHKLLARAVSIGNADMELTYQNLYGSALRGERANAQQYYAYSMRYNCTDRLKYIDQPTLLIYGQKDTSFSRYAHLLHDKLPNSSLYFIKDAPHQVPIKNPYRMNDLIRLWVESLNDRETERVKLDLEIAKKLNPAMYSHDEDIQGLPLQ